MEDREDEVMKLTNEQLQFKNFRKVVRVGGRFVTFCICRLILTSHVFVCS